MIQDTFSPQSHREKRTDNRTPHILVAEDDGEWRYLVARALRADGYKVTEVADGGRVLVHLAKSLVIGKSYETYDVVVSDIRMPVCSGLQILERLRRANWPTPVVLMTAFGSRATHEQAEALGAIVFDKPFDVDDLRTALVNVLQRLKIPVDCDSPELAVVAAFTTMSAALIAKTRLEAAAIATHLRMPDAVDADASGVVRSVVMVYVASEDIERACAVLDVQVDVTGRPR